MGTWRIENEKALYHVLSRGNEWRHIASDDRNRAMFLDTLEKNSGYIIS